ncbi:hypothetical protein [Stenotrophomonas sp. 278]|uniref:hypothetical protein n=1 Tax=Stenotrophomonas sp. 278 TaxID=2479851 RepID=UPI000F671F44|nr:hypothetical protein [Stenotrophomonas sp. 278]
MQEIQHICVIAAMSSLAPFALAQKGTDNHGVERQAHELNACDNCTDLSLDPEWTVHSLLNYGATGIQISDLTGQIKLTVGVNEGRVWAVPADNLNVSVSLPSSTRPFPQDAIASVVYFDEEITVSRFEGADQVIWHVQPTETPNRR